MPTPSATNFDCLDFGDSLGSFRSTSENVQKVLVVVGLIAGAASAFLTGAAGVMYWALGGLIFTVIAYAIVRQISWFSDKIELFEKGIVLTLRGKVQRIPFAHLMEFQMSTTDHYTNGTYIGSRAKLNFGLEETIRLIRCDLEYKNGKDTGRVINQLNEMATDAVRDRLAMKLESDGQLQWTPGVYLTMDTIRMVDASTLAKRSTQIEDIERCYVQDNELRLFRKGDGLPFCVMSIDHRNFSSIYSLFASLHSCYRDQDQARLKDMDLHVTNVPTAVG